MKVSKGESWILAYGFAKHGEGSQSHWKSDAGSAVDEKRMIAKQ